MAGKRTGIEDLRQCLLERGLRFTKQRECIAGEFLRAKGHVTAAELYKRVAAVDKTIGFATVYRTLNVLKSCGMAEEKSFGAGGSRFERAAEQTHHDHFICERCGAIIEFVSPEIERLQDEISKRYGFHITRHDLDIYGVCEGCKKKGA